MGQIWRLISPKRLVATVLVVLFLANLGRFQFSETLPPLAAAFIVAAGLDLALSALRKHRLILPDSATISALIIASVLLPGQAWWIAAVAALVAIAQKHLFALAGERPLANPAAFGLFAVFAFFGAEDGWWTAEPFWLVFPLILLTNWRNRSLDVLAFFLATFLALALLKGTPATIALGLAQNPVLWFFAGIMVPEPQTAPRTPLGRAVYAALCAALAHLFPLLFRFTALIPALLVADVLVGVGERLAKRR